MLRRRIAYFVRRFFQIGCRSDQKEVQHNVVFRVPPHRATALSGCSCIFGVSKNGCKFPDHTPGIPIPSLHLDYRGYRTMSARLWQPLLPRVLVGETEWGAHEMIRRERETPFLSRKIFSPSLDAASPGYLKPPSRHALVISDAARVFFKFVRPEDMLSETEPHIRKSTDRHEVLFVHEGTGYLDTAFGFLPYHESSYLVIPKGVEYRVVAQSPSQFFIFELKDYPYWSCCEGKYYGEKYFPFSKDAIISPQLLPKKFEKEKTKLLVIADAGAEKHLYDSSPFATMAWSGQYYPYAISLKHIRSLPEGACSGLARYATFTAINEAGEKTALIYTVRPYFYGKLAVYEDPQYDTLWFCHKKSKAHAIDCEAGEFVVYPRGSSYHFEDHAGVVSVVLKTRDRLHVAHNFGVRSEKGYPSRILHRVNPDSK